MGETGRTGTVIYEEECDLILESKFGVDEDIKTIDKYFQWKINSILKTYVSKDSIEKYGCRQKKDIVYIHIPIRASMDKMIKIGNEIKGRCSAKINNFVIKKPTTEKV